MPRRLARWALPSLFLSACVPAALPEVEAPTHLEDPGPPPPTASTEGTTGAPTAVVVRTVGDDVLELAQAALLAFVEGDREGLERVLAPSLVRVSPVFGKTRRSRSAVLAIALNPSRRSGATPGVPLDRLVLLDDLRAATLADLGETALPPGVSPSDVLVQVSLTNDGQSLFRAILPGWGDTAQLLIGAEGELLVKGL